MTWQEFVSALDVVRSNIRSTKPLKEEASYEDMNEMLLWVRDQIAAPTATKPINIAEEMSAVVIPADLAACVPDEEPVSDIQTVVDRGDGEGRMVIERRKTPLIVREPNVIEVTEKELAK